MLESLDLDTIAAARVRIAPYLVRTPLLRHALRSDCELPLKPESLQPIGAFKLRGAFSIDDDATARRAPASSPTRRATMPRRWPAPLASSALRAVIVMPSDVTALKRERTEADGAEVVLVDPAGDERERRADAIARERGFVFVPPYDHPLVAAGQGTAALELFEDAGPFERFYAPISGGGLMAGCAVALHALAPGTELVGVEPADGNDTRLSLAAGERCSIPLPKTIADGLRMRTPGAFTFPVLQKHLARVELVSDEAMLDAMAFALRELRLVLEPSGAASLAAALREGRGRCGVLLSGGNVGAGAARGGRAAGRGVAAGAGLPARRLSSSSHPDRRPPWTVFATSSSSMVPAPPSRAAGRASWSQRASTRPARTVLRALLDRNPKVRTDDRGRRPRQRQRAASSRCSATSSASPGCPLEACSFNSNRQCGSSMETLHRIAMSIVVGAIDCGVALGIERMGRVARRRAAVPQTRASPAEPAARSR